LNFVILFSTPIDQFAINMGVHTTSKKCRTVPKIMLLLVLMFKSGKPDQKGEEIGDFILNHKYDMYKMGNTKWNYCLFVLYNL
jgi:hypothetical protein